MEQGFRFVLLFRQEVLSAQSKIVSEEQQDSLQAAFIKTEVRSHFDVQRDLSAVLGPPEMIDGAYVLWDLQKIRTTSCCEDEYVQIWADNINPHMEMLNRMGRDLLAQPKENAPRNVENEILQYSDTPDGEGIPAYNPDNVQQLPKPSPKRFGKPPSGHHQPSHSRGDPPGKPPPK